MKRVNPIRNIIFAVFAFLPCASMFAADEHELFPIEFSSARAMALGGPHAALADDFDTLFANPAGFSSIDRELSVAAVYASVSDFDTVFKLFRSESMDTATVVAQITNRYKANIDIGGPLSLGFINGEDTKSGFGIGLINRTFMQIWWDRNTIFDLSLNVGEEVALIGGASFPTHNFEESVTFTPGFSIKPFFRTLFRPEGLNIVEFRYIFQTLNEKPFETQIGIGVDFGFMLTINKAFTIAAVVYDVVSPVYISRYKDYPAFSGGDSPLSTEWAMLTSRANISICFRTRDTIISETFTDMIFMLDYSGLFNLIANGTERNPLLDIGFGIEIQIINNLAIRLGFKQMMPAGGLGINMHYLQLNITLLGETFGDNLESPQNLSLNIGLTFRY
jgi:hypothetical protein